MWILLFPLILASLDAGTVPSASLSTLSTTTAGRRRHFMTNNSTASSEITASPSESSLRTPHRPRKRSPTNANNLLPIAMGSIRLPHEFTDQEMQAIRRRLHIFSLELGLYTAVLSTKSSQQRQGMDSKNTWPIMKAILEADSETCQTG